MMLWKDYETFYSDEYSLTRMIRTEYLNDPRFKAHGCAFAVDDGPFFWVTGADLPRFFKEVGPHVKSMCCHNGLFDHGITSLFYMPERKMLLDTMSMAQVALSKKFPGIRMSLAKLAQWYFPNDPTRHKHEGILGDFKGIWQLNAEQEKRMAGYACQDGHVMRELFKAIIREDVPWDFVLEDISLTLGMGVYPQLRMNTALAGAIAAEELRQKEEAVASLNLDRAQLRSGAKFAQLLLDQGVTPPMKANPKGEMIYAFAAKDVDFLALQEHDNPTVRALVELRIGEKSAQTMTRSARFARLPEALPIPLKVAAAHTGRHGGDEYNMQNLDKKGKLRECVHAPEGFKVVAGDLAGIELRMNAEWCDEPFLLGPWKENPNFDHYSVLATTIFGRPIHKCKELEDERYAGKQGLLSCQYGAGAEKVTATMKGNGVECSPELGNKIKKSFRASCRAIVKRWAWLNDVAIPALAGHTAPIQCKGVRFEKGRAILPSGRSIYYPDLRVNEDGEWVYKTCKKAVYEKKLYGGALLENLIQAMSYDVFMYQQRRIARELQPLAMAVHDEGVFVVRNDLVDTFIAKASLIYQAKPEWMAGWDVPIFGEFGVGQTYADAK